MELLQNNTQHDAIWKHVQRIYKWKWRDKKLQNFITKMELKNIII